MTRIPRFSPLLVVFILNAVLALGMIFGPGGGDALYLARLGTRFSLGDPAGTSGYDGQFVYYIATDFSPEKVKDKLDVPAYRYQRILYPLLTRALCLGNFSCYPWMMIALNLISLVLGTWCLMEIFRRFSINPWYALLFGLWAGFTLALIVDLPEPMAYALVSAAVLFRLQKRAWVSTLLFGLALFTKEVTILFWIAAFLEDLLRRNVKNLALLTGLGLMPFILFQYWLWKVFGQPGIGSGGEMASGFEIIPLMGLWRIGEFSVLYLAGMFVVFGPTLILPAFWGIWQSIKCWWSKERNLFSFALFLNAVMLLFLPFSTFRETGGLIRLGSGLVVSLLYFCGRYRKVRVLNLLAITLVLNVFLFK